MLLRFHGPRRASAPSTRCLPVDTSLAGLLHARERWVRRIESALAPLSIAFPEYSVLCCLSDSHGPLARRELAAVLSAQGTDGSEAAIRSLLAKGLVEPDSSQAGAGTARIVLTSTGRTLQAVAAGALDCVSDMFGAMLSDADRAAFDRILSSIR